MSVTTPNVLTEYVPTPWARMYVPVMLVINLTAIMNVLLVRLFIIKVNHKLCKITTALWAYKYVPVMLVIYLTAIINVLLVRLSIIC